MGPSPFPLMHPTLVARPFHRAGWVYEEKVDGWRMVAIKIDGRVRLVSRNGHDLTRRFPELVNTLTRLNPPALILDGEVAVYDHAFISRFEWLQGRPKDALATLPVYMVFDLLALDGKDLRGEPLKPGRIGVSAAADGIDGASSSMAEAGASRCPRPTRLSTRWVVGAHRSPASGCFTAVALPNLVMSGRTEMIARTSSWPP
jgi:ATP-dependent DNA ligase